MFLIIQLSLSVSLHLFLELFPLKDRATSALEDRAVLMTLLCKICSLDEQREHHLGAAWECSIPAPHRLAESRSVYSQIPRHIKV